MGEIQSEVSNTRISMRVSGGSQCFALVDFEKSMGPDDWAWSFLRLNKKYRAAYQAINDMVRQERTQQEIEMGWHPTHSKARFDRKIHFVDLHICESTFGLSAWLDPELTDLPSLGEGDSWFAPLKSIIAEPRFDALKKKTFGYQVLHKYLESESGMLAAVQKHLIQEEILRRQRREILPSDTQKLDVPIYTPVPPSSKNSSIGGNPKKPLGRNVQMDASARYPDADTQTRRWMDASVWFLIDCTVPPDGQIDSIRAIAHKFSDQMAEGGLSSTAFEQDEFKIETIKDGSWASQISLPIARATTPAFKSKSDQNIRDAWRLARICLMGQLSSELEKARLGLVREHESLVKSGLAEKPLQQRFHPVLAGNHEGVGRDGSTLKAYLVMAEFNSAGITDSKEIIKALAKMGAGSELPKTEKRNGNPWLEDIEERAILFDNHAKRGQAYVDGGYKWLIHTQNPPR
jgi:hypothetical protein